MTEKRSEVEEAEDALYSHLDRWGAEKRITYLISRLIDAKVEEAISDLKDLIEEGLVVRP